MKTAVNEHLTAEVVIVMIHAGIVILVVLAVTVLAAMRVLTSEAAVVVFGTALGFSGGKASATSGRGRSGDDAAERGA